MNEKLQIIFGLLGGLAVFIYGMNMMSECLQKAAGEKMKSILALLTKNPVLGVIAGALTTAVLQSSSCLLYTSPSPRDPKTSRMPSSA